MGSLRRRIPDDEGVTLVEMMVAILIIGIVLTALAASLVTSLASASRQESDIQANAVANALVEELRGLDYRAVALCTGEATAVFGSPLTFEGDPLVLLPDTDPQCTGPAADRPLPVDSVVQDGRTYDVQLAIAWIDDGGDGLGAADLDGTTQDYKRLVADLTWEDRDNTYSSRTETRRAPEAIEQPMSVQVAPLVTRLRDEGDASGVTGRNDAAFTFQASHVLKQSSVVVTWQDRFGVGDSAPLSTSDSGFTWTFTVPFNDGFFPNGETLFTFTATDPSSTVTEVVTRKLFLHDLEFRSVVSNGTTLRSSGSNLATTSQLQVDPAGTACDLDISAGMRGMLLSDTLEIGFSHDPTDRFALTGVGQTPNGADYAIDLAGTAGFPVAVPPATSADITATLYADRVVDPPAAPVQYSWTVTVTPVAACP